MKLARYGERGAEKPALVDGDGKLRDLSGHVADIAGDVLTDLETLKAIDPASLPLVEGSPRLGACVGGTRKFICIGLNYADHAAESGMDVPPEPVIFAKFTSAICGPNDPIIIPRKSVKTDWEVELGFVIGKTAKYVKEEDAMDHVAGFCLINDVSEREFQAERAGQWVKGKSSDNFGPTGPWLVTPDEVGDFDSLGMWLDVNGKRMQDGSTATMVYRVPFLVSYLSQFFTLEPGDIISTGTPPGVGLGMKPPVYLKAGDVVELGIEKLGSQRQDCIDDA
ncbi:fumarylacetoacetate hydrolase family protein [Salipiger marinus]|jgi:2-keto-4-pentenoate hydratase/2-oxohepta-3-ene-1,7-dioic acid hydratase in catechol pathway|uniref:fumarylacetoacetate hydrolase family protein n=1 Tax=Salipiger marinus TaxID=555512 RepID=UPI000E9AC56C|nr:fumarylacetoacetate hydrolase family protein [Salipiger manganoxidans]MCD1620320.1 fumarylacetoacetate hydrolase family protein [Salipiger manganoxidans]MEB3421028.1 fumarylacetoacetate hydrolase family protein [Salipiger manganoxidans]HBM60148.1 2-hydroxyhepta-2,4-diene-1,7-dioate isomerase [Citreicella sp.]HBS98853.1 2-hydroxyhepta-2,4-diene-1,7-dioate isomerase [Citreicella sp.]